MKTLYLLRHAKSSWKDHTLPDRDRPLNKRGKTDLAAMAPLYSSQIKCPLVIVTSPSRRTLKTAIAVASCLGISKSQILREEALYLASADLLLSYVRQIDPVIENLLVCGHNPGFTDLLNRLCDVRLENLPTCALATLHLSITRWDELEAGRAILEKITTPKDIAK